MVKSVSSITPKEHTISAFFSGVGGIELGFKQTGKFRVLYANEFDKSAQITYKMNHMDTELDPRDIHDVSDKDIPDSDILVGGFPCQAFSIAGYRKGFEDERGDLFFEMLRFIKKKEPKAIFIENVKNMVTHDHGNTFKVIREALVTNGYLIKWMVLNGKDHGNVPQNRERIYIVGFKNKEAFEKFTFPTQIPLTNNLNSIINFEGEEEEKYYYREGKQPFYDKIASDVISKDSIYQWRRQYVRENKSGVVPTLTANMGTGGHNVPLIYTEKGVRKLTPRETFNAQGYPKDFILPDISNAQLYKQAGNSVVVPVIRRIAGNIAFALEDVENYSKEFTSYSAKYALIHLDIHGRYSGESHVVDYFNTIEEMEYIAESNNVPILSDLEYLRLVQKGKSLEFYSIVPL